MNPLSKLARVEPTAAQKPPYIRGTEPGHFYLVLDETPLGVIGFRTLDRPYPAIGESPADGQHSRVRVVLTSPTLSNSCRRLFSRLGFEWKQYDAQEEPHFSITTTNPTAAINDAEILLQTLTSFGSLSSTTGLGQTMPLSSPIPQQRMTA